MSVIGALGRVAVGTFKYGKRFLKTTPELVFGTGSEKIAEALAKKGDVFTKAKAGWNALETTAKTGNFWGRTWKSITEFFPSLAKGAKEGAKAATAAGKSGFFGGLKGIGKTLSKNMPLIGSALLLAMELPNIVTATKEKGLWQGIKETVKAGAKLIGGSIGAAIGTYLIPIPFVGSAVGYMVGEWLTGKIVGQSYTEEKAEKEEQKAEIMQEMGISPQNQGMTPYPTGQYTNPYSSYPNYMYNNSAYADDIFMKNMRFDMMA